ncbi:hypothetical protein PTSG_11031 [Salpingoeca rosetta]|uniref:Gamma-secretase subunit PEN-2 n=1 Tax=Salpingoeca rosetta (strain ATCC 50818 / BSB-021) TaxID=946362 RepID=F2USH7_SALR5|nr:uncharacterized protein PTSG_11031 [Salpingoeca rosetta]EGD81086.1 hypothetical protein PTSG_11031 [Salpingoeca rosetta]|eukprot:XP_004987955.1 hypothetical protein PTSG_11031 [Salpingoeca rosetta]
MDLRRTPAEEKLRVCKLYFYVGFAFLPWLWLVNAVWFARESRQMPELRKYVIWSAVGAVIYFAALIAWAVIFQDKRSEWGAFGDRLSVVIPKGRA